MILTDLSNTMKKWWEKISFHKLFKSENDFSNHEDNTKRPISGRGRWGKS